MAGGTFCVCVGMSVCMSVDMSAVDTSVGTEDKDGVGMWLVMFVM